LVSVDKLLPEHFRFEVWTIVIIWNFYLNFYSNYACIYVSFRSLEWVNHDFQGVEQMRFSTQLVKQILPTFQQHTFFSELCLNDKHVISFISHPGTWHNFSLNWLTIKIYQNILKLWCVLHATLGKYWLLLISGVIIQLSRFWI
jgi:hypothetical protein